MVDNILNFVSFLEQLNLALFIESLMTLLTALLSSNLIKLVVLSGPVIFLLGCLDEFY